MKGDNSIDRLAGAEELFGKVIDDRYLILSEPAPEGTRKSWLFCAKEVGEMTPGRNVALKVLKPGQQIERVEQFREEIKTTANLPSCPEIATVYGGGRDGEYFYIAMEYVPGDNLQARISKGERFSLEWILDFTTSLSKTVEFCHQQGVTHNDLKLKNVKEVDQRGRVLDFGSKFTRDRDYDDVYALGVRILRELLDHRTGPKNIPRGLLNIIERSQANEFESIEEFCETIECFKSGISRRKFIRGVAATSAILLSGGAAYIYSKHSRSIEHIQEQISGEQDYNQLQKLFEELNRRLFEQKIIKIARKIPAGEFPFGTVESGEWYTSRDINYANGFWPGILWEGFRSTKNHEFEDLARKSASNIRISPEDDQMTTAVRFLYSHAKAYDVTGEQEFRQEALAALEKLKTEYNGGFFSPFGQTVSEAGIMMDVIPFFLWGYRQTQDEELIEMVRSHARKAVKFHIRENGSVRKTAVLNESLEVVDELNSKGIGNNTTFARSQAQMLYGLVEHTLADPEMLWHAKRVADYFLRPQSLNDNGVSYADLEADTSNFPSDTSATAIALPALRKLSGKDSKYLEHYFAMKKALVKHYLCPADFSGILRGACESWKRKAYVNSSLVFGDYHFLIS